MNDPKIKLIQQQKDRLGVREVYDCGDFIRKSIPNNTHIPHPLENIQQNAEMINRVLGFKYFIDVRVDDNTIITDIAKLKKCNLHIPKNVSDYNKLMKQLEIFLRINLKIWPYANTDISANNIMMHNSSYVIIDWDDTLQGYRHQPLYVVAELYKEMKKNERKFCISYEAYLRQKTEGTVLQVNDAGWDWIIKNCKSIPNFHLDYQEVLPKGSNESYFGTATNKWYNV